MSWKFGLIVCLLLPLVGCVQPDLVAVDMSPGSVESPTSTSIVSKITDPIVEHAVDYAKASVADPLGQDIAAAIAKNFGGDLQEYRDRQKLADELRKDRPAQAQSDQPDDVLHIVVCDLNEDGSARQCHPPQLVARKDWPAFWQASEGSGVFRNGRPIVKFTTVKVDRAKSPSENPDDDGPQLPIVVKPTALWSPGQAFKQGASGTCGCNCPNCQCGSKMQVVVPTMSDPYRGRRVTYRCKGC